MTETEMNVLYEQNVNLLRKTVWDFMRHLNIHPRNFDELFSQSNLYFMLAVTSYDENISKFSTWLHTQVWGRLLTENIRVQREWESLKSFDDIREHNNPHDEPGCFVTIFADFRNIDWNDELSKDAKCLIRLVYRGGIDFDEMLKYKRSGLRRMFKYLRGHGWSRRRIHVCFKNLKRLLD
jgi:DNA-directed RNA polymerase specialized sigma24 family protein